MSLDAKTLLKTINELKRRDSATTRDDSNIDYLSVLGHDDKTRRFSEDLVDVDVKSNLQLRKLYRQIQRQIHCSGVDEVKLSLSRLPDRRFFLDFKTQPFRHCDFLWLILKPLTKEEGFGHHY